MELVASIGYKLACAFCEDSYKSVHPCSLISLKFSLKNVGPLAIHRAPMEDSDQTAQMRRLI